MATSSKPHEALILAGGFGTRLREAVSDVPKPMAPVAGRPFLEILMDHWLAQGVGRFVLSVGYLAECIMEHFKDSYKGAKVEYVREMEPLGTGGAVALALSAVPWQGQNFLLLNGDTWIQIPLDTFWQDAQAAAKCPVTVALTPVNKNDRYGGVETDSSGLVRRFSLPPDGEGAMINAGCYLMNTDAVKTALKPCPPRFSLEQDFLSPLAEHGSIAASLQNADFIDIGVVEDYRRFCGMFLKDEGFVDDGR